MCLSDYLNQETMENFVKECSQHGFDNYEPYINYDFEPDVQASEYRTPLLDGSGMKLFEDKNSFAVFLLDCAGKLTGYCSAFPCLNKDDSPSYEISVLIAPMYRRHRLGSMLLSRMLSIIAGEKKGENELTSDIIENLAIYKANIFLAGSNEGFAEYNGFTYSHSEHFMTRKAASELNIGTALKPVSEPATSIADTKLPAFAHPAILITRTSQRTAGRRTYRLFSDGRSASRCTILECSDYVNIANLYTNKAFRGRHYAGQLISAIAADYPQKKLLLQVSGSNTAAIHAYTEAGFTFLKSFDYYSPVSE